MGQKEEDRHGNGICRMWKVILKLYTSETGEGYPDTEIDGDEKSGRGQCHLGLLCWKCCTLCIDAMDTK